MNQVFPRAHFPAQAILAVVHYYTPARAPYCGRLIWQVSASTHD